VKFDVRSVGGKPFLAVTAFAVLLCTCGFTQETAPSTPPATPPDAPSATQSAKKNPLTNPATGFVQLLERKSFAFPDIATDQRKFGPEQKFKLFVNNSVSPVTIITVAASAGWNQALDSPEGYGQGAEGYGKRFGSSMARVASANFFGTFVLASVLREDPRFYVKKDLSFGAAVKYSLVRVLVTRTDSGKNTLNVSGLVGPLGAEMLANTYFPAGNRSTGDALVRFGYDMVWKAAGNMMKQYWPTINKRLLKPKA
jgi:hypothetical protein